MATKLGLFNGALTELGVRRVSDTGETVEPAQELVAVYDRVVAECLAGGSWNWATETIQSDADTGITPNFGFTEVFAKPSDWVRTVSVSSDPDLVYPLIHYYDDANFWSADFTPIYVRYVSNDTGMGLELTRWTQAFTRYVELELASRVAYRLTSDKDLSASVMALRDRAKKNALNQDAMNEPQPKFPPAGSWTQSRTLRSYSRDGGTRSNITS